MQFFTIRDIENLSGIKAHTLRIWEQRYNLFIPKRKESLHRIYDNNDLKQLLKISFLYHNGWKISRIASLTHAQIADEIHNTELSSKSYNTAVLKLIEAAIDFDEVKFVNILNEISKAIGFEKCIAEVCYPYLQRIGLLWMTNNLIPAQEHFTSYIIQNRIIAETEKLPLPEKEPNVILFAPRGEFHELPLLFINYLLRKNGWGVIYLGANIAKEVLKQFTGNQKIEYLFLHLITNFTGWDADVYIEDLQKNFSGKIIVATGAAIQQLQRNFVNVMLLKNDQAIYEFIEKTTAYKR
jgi:MerR family transcriptional regulator, light-induced transcriptional regulator